VNEGLVTKKVVTYRVSPAEKTVSRFPARKGATPKVRRSIQAEQAWLVTTNVLKTLSFRTAKLRGTCRLHAASTLPATSRFLRRRYVTRRN